jgi:ABC-type sugar transport system permease subunit
MSSPAATTGSHHGGPSRGEPGVDGTPPATTGGVRRFTRQWFDTRALPWLLLAPALLLIFGLVGYPVIRTFYLSFHDAGLASLVSGEMDFVGLEHYREILGDAHLRRVFLVTVVFGLACVAATMVLGVAVALLLNRPFKGRWVLGVVVLLPWAMPRVAAATVWQWLFHDQYGLVNWVLVRLGLDGFDGYSWFISPLPAFFAIGVVVVWGAFPFVAISVLAGLQSVPDDVLEAARIDGATAGQRLRLVILPMLKPLLLVLIVISTIWDFKVFDQIYVMTQGGPARSTEVLAITTWREAFTQLDFGLGSALAMAMFLILTAITIVYIRMIREEEGL